MIIKTLFSILSGIKSIVKFFKFVFTFITTLVKELVSFVSVVHAVISSIPRYMLFFPAAITVLLVVFISCAVMFRLLGREG